MKKLLLGTTLAVFTAMTLTAGIVSARGHGEGGQCRPEITFEMLDTDGNGAITAAEMTAKAMQRFNAGDANDDGFLSVEEILAAGKARMAEHRGDNAEAEDSQRAERAALMIERLFERQDANNDGLLSPEEMKPGQAADRFEQSDTDGNGEISEAEFDVAKETLGEGGFGKKGRRGHGNCDNG